MKWIGIAALTGALLGAVLFADRALGSRNASGTMAGVNGPYTAGSVISSSVINARLADIETEITDSLNRSGKGGMLAALRGTDGTVTAPALSFTSETGSGIYRIGSSDVGFSINQSKVGEWTANGYRSGNGAVATPSLSFFNDTGSGLYRGGSNDIRFAVNGADKTFWGTAGFGISAAPTYPLDVMGTVGLVQARFTNSTNPSLFIYTGASNTSLGFNLRHDGSNIKYDTTNSGVLLQYETGATAALVTYTAPSGTGGNTATVTERLRVNTSGVTIANDLTVSGNMTLTGSVAALKIGSGGTSSTQLNFGSCTLNGASPSQCTATVVAGAKCVASTVGSVNDSAAASVSVSATTLTVTKENGSTKVVNYICF